MLRAWLALPDPGEFTNWKPNYIRDFVRQIGPDYDFLFTEYSARFIANDRSYPHANDFAVVSIQAQAAAQWDSIFCRAAAASWVMAKAGQEPAFRFLI
jgi:hypothetical protein